MKAIVITEAGGPEVLKLQKTDKPAPKENEVLVKIKAAGVNRSDILTRENPDAYGEDLPSAQIPGLEVAGIVEEVKSKNSKLNVGDKICALVAGGGYAEYICVDERLCLPIPKGLSFAEAASLPEVIFTVWFNLFQKAKLTKGEKLLIHGGTSGIGVMGLQIAQALGITTYATAGSSEKIDFLKKIGVSKAIHYKKEAFSEILKEEKLDVILDMVGGDYTNKNLELLQSKGRLVNINAMKSAKVTIDLWQIISKNLILTGSLLKPQPINVKAKIAKEVETTVWPLFKDKQIKPFIEKTFPLEKAGEAHQLMESSSHIGKIILNVDE
ncbi:NAD(P)H-quinone oxidoreductase [Mesonia oceanica]|uniref:Mycocerosic acid synthase-like polyketide synthase n=1 Tax=Mesonia oceanica TaxID=2687242 RepID=A0AC61Y9T8_9FLAO|nr:NAD(P)H-quinone oxidoreductase [Mesonia oceanica]MAQ40211.1 zinc-binding dehydrogenase [Mesonia sp.]MBJ97122.1 zinc-binding dehydrogenase [Flavobacteriaceae bacterium]VVV00638.1 Mycocerosic acid synthase-like polyketide synthase [Mesonia oceanica]|tara:strand:- start:20363 stop:21340 length:978 start_codon:yes stop_codon:yes gene_type:complete